MDFQIADGASFDSINLGAITAFENFRKSGKENASDFANQSGKTRESQAIAAAVINQMSAGSLEGATQIGLVSNNVAVNNMSTSTFSDMQIRNFNFNFTKFYFLKYSICPGLKLFSIREILTN